MKTMDERTTLDRPTSVVIDTETPNYKARNRWLMILSAVLAIAVVAMGAWLIVDDGSATVLTAEQEQMLETIDDAMIAINDGDAAALVAFYTTNGYHENYLRRYSAFDGELEDYFNMLAGSGFSVTPAADPVVVNDVVISSDYLSGLGGSETPTTSFFKMTPDGTQIMWHYAP